MFEQFELDVKRQSAKHQAAASRSKRCDTHTQTKHQVTGSNPSAWAHMGHIQREIKV